MRIVLFIGLGGFTGAISRYLLSEWIQAKFISAFPYGTLFVNILGSLLIGALFALAERGNLFPELNALLVTGLLGGFTTFSSFSLGTVNLIRDGQFLTAGAYCALSVVLGIIAAFVGIMLIKLI